MSLRSFWYLCKIFWNGLSGRLLVAVIVKKDRTDVSILGSGSAEEVLEAVEKMWETADYMVDTQISHLEDSGEARVAVKFKKDYDKIRRSK